MAALPAFFDQAIRQREQYCEQTKKFSWKIIRARICSAAGSCPSTESADYDICSSKGSTSYVNGHVAVQRMIMPTHSPFAKVLHRLGKKDLHRRRNNRPDLLSVWSLRTVFVSGLSFHTVD